MDPKHLINLAMNEAATVAFDVDPLWERARTRMIALLNAKDEDDLYLVTAEPTPPDHIWAVGDLVEYIRDREYGPCRRERLEIVEIDPNYATRPASQYSVFWTGFPGAGAKWWTTPEDVRLVKAANRR